MIRSLAVTAIFASVIACTPKPAVHMSAPTGTWISVFDGKDLNDWTVKIAGHDVNDNYRNTFRVEDGLLKVSYRDYDKFAGSFGSIYYNKPLSHYWLRVEYRFVGDEVAGAPSWAFKNSGIQLHSQSPQSMRKEQEFPVSVEFDIVGGHAIGGRPTGDVCRTGTELKIDGAALNKKCSTLSDITIRGDEWVTVEAEVNGATSIKQIVNGTLVVAYTDIAYDEKDPDAKRLINSSNKALTSGLISLQSNGHPIEFRRVEILPIE